MGLKALEKKIERDLTMINFPPKPWRIEDDGIYDVVIVGAGMAAAFALQKMGVSKIQLIDASEEGKEGPWVTYARMQTLRSPKHWMGPALGLPSLSFPAWFESQFGNAAWEALGKIPTAQWMEYLTWYRRVLKLPVQHKTRLEAIIPGQYLTFQLSKGEMRTHKVVLATGRAGFGGAQVPAFVQKLPHWAHTNERIDFQKLRGKRVAVLGGGASGFDAATGFAIDGAKQPEIAPLMRLS